MRWINTFALIILLFDDQRAWCDNITDFIAANISQLVQLICGVKYCCPYWIAADIFFFSSYIWHAIHAKPRQRHIQLFHMVCVIHCIKLRFPIIVAVLSVCHIIFHWLFISAFVINTMVAHSECYFSNEWLSERKKTTQCFSVDEICTGTWCKPQNLSDYHYLNKLTIHIKKRKKNGCAEKANGSNDGKYLYY